MARIGILGGTFDPVHYGHLDAAVVARRALALDHVVLVPARVPPHKTPSQHVSAYHRFAMTALATSDDDALRVSDLELRSADPSYTSLTLQHLALAGYDPAQLFFITGADAFAKIAQWHDYPGLLSRSHFVVVSRPGHALDALRLRLPDLAGRMHAPGDRTTDGPESGVRGTAIWLTDATTRDISSSVVRDRIAEGESVDDLLPPPVVAYIARHRLYDVVTRG